MLISITESCHMGCTHCMDDAKPSDNHMSYQVFRDAVDFFNEHGNIEFVITGGEPTDHPKFWDFLIYAANNVKGNVHKAHITVTTNAMNLVHNSDAFNKIQSLYDTFDCKITFQVTSVDEYYPIKIDLNDDIFNLPNVILCQEIEAMYPMGRARDNNLEYNSKGSKCFNIRSLTRDMKSLDKAITILSLAFRFCTPQIDIYGNIKLGESLLCPIASTIYKTNDEIVEDICNFKCGYCNIVNSKLPKEYLEKIGEI